MDWKEEKLYGSGEVGKVLGLARYRQQTNRVALNTSTIKQISRSPHFTCICFFHFLFNALAFIFHSLGDRTFCLIYSWHSRLSPNSALPPRSWCNDPPFCSSFFHLLPHAWNSMKSLEIAIRPHHTFLFFSSCRRSNAHPQWLIDSHHSHRRLEVQSCSSPHTFFPSPMIKDGVSPLVPTRNAPQLCCCTRTAIW